jgi:PKD repeat protein
MFTNGQKARSRALFAPGGARASLLNSQGCAGSVDPPPVTLCGDTLRFPLPGTAIIYFDEDQGFIAGTNIYNDRAKADRFSVTSSTQLSGGLFYFGFAQSSNTSLPITIKAWNSDGAGGSPGTVLAQTTVPISVISQAVNNQSYLAINFPSPVTVNGVFYLGYDVPSANDATISLVTNTAGDANPNTAWEQFSNNAWFPYSDAQSWEISISHAISAILVTPQPSAAFSALPVSICEGQTVTFQANNSAGIENYLWTFQGGNPASSTAISPVVTYLSQGSYGATLSVSNQCFAQALTQTNNNAVNVVAAPPVPSITQQGENLVSSASNNNQWYLDGGLIPGATGQSFSPDQNGLYTVEVSNGSCSSFSSPFQYLSVGIEAPIAEQISIFPNPASNVIYVDYHNATAYQLELMDISGKVIYAEKVINNGMHLIDLNACGVSQGVFLIKLFDGNQIFTRRIVIMP